MKATACKLAVVAAIVLAVGFTTVYCESAGQASSDKSVKAKAAAKKPATAPAKQIKIKPVRVVDPAFEAFRKKSQVPAVRVPKVAKPPKVDGKMDALYKKCEPMTFKFITGGRGKTTAATTAYAVSTNMDLFLFFRCQSPDMDALLADVRDRDGQVWSDDSIEIFIDPTNRRLADGYVHLIINAIGTTAEAKGPKGAEDFSWNPKLSVKTTRGKKAWTVELAIAFKDLVPNPAKINRLWAVNLNRMAYLIEGNEDTCWSPTGGTDSHVPSKFGTFWLVAGKVDNTKD